MPSRVRIILTCSAGILRDRRAMEALRVIYSEALRRGYISPLHKQSSGPRWQQAIETYKASRKYILDYSDGHYALKVVRERRGLKLKRPQMVKKVSSRPARWLEVAQRRFQVVDPAQQVEGNVMQGGAFNFNNIVQAAVPEPVRRRDGIRVDPVWRGEIQ